jgi:hypothetical protein
MWSSRLRIMMLLIFVSVSGGMTLMESHQNPCHRLLSCPSNPHTYICGDRGRCEQCHYNQYCLGWKPRTASTASPAPAQLSPGANIFTSPENTTVYFIG